MFCTFINDNPVVHWIGSKLWRAPKSHSDSQNTPVFLLWTDTQWHSAISNDNSLYLFLKKEASYTDDYPSLHAPGLCARKLQWMDTGPTHQISSVESQPEAQTSQKHLWVIALLALFLRTRNAHAVLVYTDTAGAWEQKHQPKTQMPAQECFTKAAMESGSDLPQPGTSQDCIWVSLSNGNAGKPNELLYKIQEHTREMELRRSSMITLPYHLAHRASRPRPHPHRRRTDPAELAKGTHSTAWLLRGSVCARTSSSTVSRSTKASQAAQLSEKTGLAAGWASTHLCSGKCPFSPGRQLSPERPQPISLMYYSHRESTKDCLLMGTHYLPTSPGQAPHPSFVWRAAHMTNCSHRSHTNTFI